MFYLLPPTRLALAKGDTVPSFIPTHGFVMFFLMMGLEGFLGTFLVQKSLYRFNDFLGSISSGTCQQLCVALISKFANPKRGYRFIQDNYSLMAFDVRNKPWSAWVCLMLGVDLAYYWAHRSLHVLHAGWAAHSVHHSGEDYNLATALRQGALQPLMTWVFSLPLALIFPAESILVHTQLNTLYQFWIHTEMCGRLGMLEYFFNTPFHHRMHHRPPGNCNYAGVLIIWDRLFGTYEAETERLDHFGLAQPAATFSPVELNLQHWKKMGRFHFLRGGCFWHFLRSSVSLRAHHNLVWKPSGLLQPLPGMKEDKSSWSLPERQVRSKYQGAELQLTGKMAAISMFMGAFVCLQRADKAEQRHSVQLLCAVSGGLAWLSALGDLLDAGGRNFPFWRKFGIASVLTSIDMSLFHFW